MAKATVYDRGAQMRLAKAEKKILRQGVATTQDIVTLGKEFARFMAPKRTCNVYKAIKGTTKQTPDGARGEIFVDTEQVKSGLDRMTPGPNSKWKYPDFDLVFWMHRTGGQFRSDNPYGKAGTQHINRDNAQFMYRTRSYLKGIGVDVARRGFKIKF